MTAVINRQRLTETFLALVQIDSISKEERAIGEELLSRLAGLGLRTEVDDAGAEVGGTMGNIIARLDGAVGVETALYLADKGTLSAEAVKFLLVNRAEDPDVLYDLAVHGTKTVVLIEMIDKLGKDIGRTTRWGMLQDLRRMGVVSKTATKALEITSSGVTVETGEGTEVIPADTVVLAMGALPCNPLEEFLKEKGIPCQVIGDAHTIGRAYEAIHQGFEAGRSIG